MLSGVNLNEIEIIFFEVKRENGNKFVARAVHNGQRLYANSDVCDLQGIAAAQAIARLDAWLSIHDSVGLLTDLIA